MVISVTKTHLRTQASPQELRGTPVSNTDKKLLQLYLAHTKKKSQKRTRTMHF